jgi:hypothetical protein
MIPPEPVCFTAFTDGTRRPVYVDALGQYVIDDDGEPSRGIASSLPRKMDLPSS